MSFLPLLQDAAASQAQGSQSMLMSVVLFIAIIAIFYFFIIRPQNKRQKETEKMRSSLAKGDKVVTIGGIHGTVSSVKESTVIVKVEDGTRIEFDRSAIATIASDRKSPKSEKKDEKTEKIEKAEEETSVETSEGGSADSENPNSENQ